MTIDGNAIVYCENAFRTPNGKTAHGLVRRTARYHVLSVVDSTYAGHDAGNLLDNRPNGIPVFASLEEAVQTAQEQETPASHMVVGLAPDGGRLDVRGRDDVKKAIRLGLNIDSGLHDYLSEDMELAAMSKAYGVILRDIRKPPHRNELHFFTGKIAKVRSLRVALLGTDSAVGKRTTAWMLVEALRARKFRVELIGTGQTAWLQGATHGIILDSLINDFVSGEIEHAIWRAWEEEQPDVLVIEGQGSIMNPAYPGGFEILAAGRPHCIIVQHAPARQAYDGFPDFPLDPLERQRQVLELLSGRPVIAVTVNHEGLSATQTRNACEQITQTLGVPAVDPFLQGLDPILDELALMIQSLREEQPSASAFPEERLSQAAEIPS
jgi:uncharacterized NAD-dependent epimerase/dehydratase family protein